MRSLYFFNKAINEYIQNGSLSYAKKLQEKYSQYVINRFHEWKIELPEKYLVGGIDVSFINQTIAIAGIVILDQNHQQIEKKYLIQKVHFPYVPGFLSFRELEPILKLIKELEIIPDILFFDGQGISHPRFMGIATYAGILLNKPTLGIAKKKLVGIYKEPNLSKGSKEGLFYNTIQVGWVLRSKKNVKPIFISPGWKVGIHELPDIVLRFCKYRIPEPTRLAHQYVNLIRGNLKI